jgi:hypothetical protein
MKPVSLRDIPAPTPGLTLWVPVIPTGSLSLFWRGLVALGQR